MVAFPTLWPGSGVEGGGKVPLVYHKNITYTREMMSLFHSVSVRRGTCDKRVLSAECRSRFAIDTLTARRNPC